MSISSNLTKLTTDITNAYTSIENKGGTIPANKNTNNLSTAIDSIQSSNIIGATAEGESLSLTNTKAMPYSDYVVEGKSEQATSTQSANLFDENKYRNASYNTNVYKYTLTNIKGNRTLYTKCSLKSGKTSISGLYLAICNKNNPNLTGNITAWLVNGGNVNVNNHADFSNDEDIYLTFYPANTSIQDIFDTYNIMVSTDNVNYEPFTPNSPSPDYPSEIHSVADDVNLLENMTIYNSNHYISPLLKLNPGTYTFNYTGDSAPGIYIRKNDGSNPTNGTVVDQKYTANNITFSISETGNYYIHLYSSTIWEQLTMNNPKLQKGSISTPYSPYNQGTVTIKQRGKNLLNVESILALKGSKTIDLDLEAGSYTLSLSNWSTTGGNVKSQITFNYIDGTTLDVTIWPSTKIYSLTFTKKVISVKIFSNTTDGNSGAITTTYTNLMLEKGSQSTNYEPYQGNDYTIQTEPLRSLPNGVKDTIEADGIHRRVGRIVLDGTEYCANYVNSTYAFAVFLPVGIPDIKHLASVDRVLCSHLQHTILNNIYSKRETQDNNLISTQGTRSFAIMINNYTSTTELQTYLAQQYANGTPVIIQYELAEEIIEPLTQNQATTMLDIIKTGSYEGTTNIYTDEDVKPTIGVGYYKYGETGGLPTVENEKLIFDKELQIDREELIF